MNYSKLNTYYNKSPDKVYAFIKAEIDRAVNELEHTKSKNTSNQALDIIKQSRAEAYSTFDNLEESSEWNTFTITFFGETKAGKSTIIETLRLFFNERTKKEQQNKFIKMMSIKDFDYKNISRYEDGSIIGDGTSDFTTKLNEYNFKIDDKTINLIDAPGIEGKESNVISQIEKSVRKSHAVFYVVNRNTIPNEGTLKKIKKHLNSHAEVWVIYNKPATNPRAVKNEVMTDKEKKVFSKELKLKMEEVLGNAYKGYLSLYGLVAFYALAECIIPNTELSRNQLKFIKKDNKGSRQALFHKSSFDVLCDFLTIDIARNQSEKIKKSNFLKAQKVLDNMVEDFDRAINIYNNFHEDIENKVKKADISLKKSLAKNQAKSKKYLLNYLDEQKLSLRKSIYSKIDGGLNNNDFQREMKNNLKAVPKKIHKEIISSQNIMYQNLNAEVAVIIQELSDDIDKLENEYNSYNTDSVDTTFGEGLDFSVKSGINYTGVFTSVLGLGMLITGAPAVATWAVAVSGTVLVFSFGKAIWSIFDRNFKKSEQKNNAEKNISKVFNKIENKILKDIKLAENTSNKYIKEIRLSISNILEEVQRTREVLVDTKSKLINISKSLDD